MNDLRVKVDRFMPDVYPDTLADGRPHPRAGQPVVVVFDGLAHMSQKTFDLLNAAIDKQNDLKVNDRNSLC